MVKKAITRLVVFAFLSFCWLYILAFVRGESVFDVFETDYSKKSEDTIYKAIFILGEIVLIFLSKKVTAKIIDFVQFVKKSK